MDHIQCFNACDLMRNSVNALISPDVFTMVVVHAAYFYSSYVQYVTDVCREGTRIAVSEHNHGLIWDIERKYCPVSAV